MHSDLTRILSAALVVCALCPLTSCIYRAGDDTNLLTDGTASGQYREPVTTAKEDILTDVEDDSSPTPSEAEPCKLNYSSRYLDPEDVAAAKEEGAVLMGDGDVKTDGSQRYVLLSFADTLWGFTVNEAYYDKAWEKTGLKDVLYETDYQSAGNGIILRLDKKSADCGIAVTFRDGTGEIHSYTAVADEQTEGQTLSLYRAYPMTLTYEGAVEAYQTAMQNIKYGFSLGESSCYRTLQTLAAADPYLRICSKEEDINDDGTDELIVYAFSYLSNYNGAVLEIFSEKDCEPANHYMPDAGSTVFRCNDGLFLDVTFEYGIIKKVKLVTVDWLCDSKTAYIDETVKTDGTYWYHVVDGEITKIGAGEADALITSYMKMRLDI